MISSEELIKQLEDPDIDDVLVIRYNETQNLPNVHRNIFDDIIYRKSADKYYMTLSPNQLEVNINFGRTMQFMLYETVYEREITVETARITSGGIIKIFGAWYQTTVCCEHLSPLSNIQPLLTIIKIICANNYTYPPIEEWKNNQWSGLK